MNSVGDVQSQFCRFIGFANIIGNIFVDIWSIQSFLYQPIHIGTVQIPVKENMCHYSSLSL